MPNPIWNIKLTNSKIAMTNKEKFLRLVSEEETDTLAKSRERVRNRAMLRESQQIALKVMERLEELGWTQKELAGRLEVSPQQVTKIISGKENMTLETLVKLQDVLEIPILASYFAQRPLVQAKQILRLKLESQQMLTTESQEPVFQSAGKQKLKNLSIQSGSSFSTTIDREGND